MSGMLVWTVSEEKAGTLTQCIGVAQQLSPHPVIKKIGKLARWRRGVLSPYARISEPEPTLLVSCGRYAERHVREIKRAYGGRPLAIHLQPPSVDAQGIYDIAFISRHDRDRPRLAGTRYEEMIGVPHRVSRELLISKRAEARSTLALAQSDRAVAFLVGGSNGAYLYDADTAERLLGAVRGLSADGYRVLVSTSRRSEPSIFQSLLALRSDRVSVWDRTGDNPYLDYLAAADAFVITKDTVTMHSEALVSGKPVYSFDLAKAAGEKLETFEFFHSDLAETLRLTRPYARPLQPYGYDMPDQTVLIGERIRSLLDARRAGVRG